MDQAEAEALGWRFFETSLTFTAPVEKTVYNAVRKVGETLMDKTFEDKDKLLEDIAQWEASQPAVEAPAAADPAPEVVADPAPAAPADPAPVPAPDPAPAPEAPAPPADVPATEGS